MDILNQSTETAPIALPTKHHTSEKFNTINFPDDYLMSREEASLYSHALGCPIAKSTLAKIYCISSDGPPVIHFGRKVRYRVADFRAWLLGRLSAPRRSTSQPLEAA